MNDQLSKLAQLCRDATPGPWTVQGPWPTATIYVDDAAIHDDSIAPTHVASLTRVMRPEQNVSEDVDAQYIAAASPDLVALLVSVAQAAEKFVDETRNDLGSVRDEMEAGEHLAAAIDALRGRVGK